MRRTTFDGLVWRYFWLDSRQSLRLDGSDGAVSKPRNSRRWGQELKKVSVNNTVVRYV